MRHWWIVGACVALIALLLLLARRTTTPSVQTERRNPYPFQQELLETARLSRNNWDRMPNQLADYKKGMNDSQLSSNDREMNRLQYNNLQSKLQFFGV